jgi:hypothetical protein
VGGGGGRIRSQWKNKTIGRIGRQTHSLTHYYRTTRWLNAEGYILNYADIAELAAPGLSLQGSTETHTLSGK